MHSILDKRTCCLLSSGLCLWFCICIYKQPERSRHPSTIPLPVSNVTFSSTSDTIASPLKQKNRRTFLLIWLGIHFLKGKVVKWSFSLICSPWSCFSSTMVRPLFVIICCTGFCQLIIGTVVTERSGFVLTLWLGWQQCLPGSKNS